MFLPLTHCRKIAFRQAVCPQSFREVNVIAACKVHQFSRLGMTERHRLFDRHVLSGVQCQCCMVEM
jgi:hypothetical protein